MKHTSQHCSDKTTDGKTASYRECCFLNCTKSWWTIYFRIGFRRGQSPKSPSWIRPLCLQYLNCNIYKVNFYLFTDLLTAACCRANPAVFKPLCEGWCLVKFLTCEIADFTPFAHVQTAEWHSRSSISQALTVHWDVEYAENWLLGFSFRVNWECIVRKRKLNDI